MAKMSIKRKRTLQFFIDAAKDIVESEGVQQVTARKVGELSGYSYATIYNYFKDLKELLAYCALDYLKECSEEIKSIDTKDLELIEIIQKYNKKYFEYFAKRPQLFQLVFLEDLAHYPTQLMEETSGLEAGHLLLEHLRNHAVRGVLKKEDILTIHQLIISSLHGKLLFYINNRDATTIEDVLEMINKEVELILGGTKKCKKS